MAAIRRRTAFSQYVGYVDIVIYTRIKIIYMEAVMPINVNNPEADALTRKFAQMAGVSITDAIVIAMREAIERRRNSETPRQTAARLREKHGIALTDDGRKPLGRGAFEEMWKGG